MVLGAPKEIGVDPVVPTVKAEGVVPVDPAVPTVKAEGAPPDLGNAPL